MPSLTTVSVNLPQRAYNIQIGAGLIDRLSASLENVTIGHHAIIISDSNVAEIYLDRVQQQLETCFDRVSNIVFPAGEESKSIVQLEQIWNLLVEMGADRRSTVIALGGGVVGDLAGFAAASFGRGIELIQIPTSLLAQVDSSVGGKVGINLPGAKNMVGAFWQPRAVIIDPCVLDSLDQRNFQAGMAEVVKYGAALSADFFEYLIGNVDPISQRESSCLETVIAESCRTKAWVVIEDERETSGVRALLNYGHTFGHAIEAVYGFGEYLHGEAIAIGMECATTMATDMGILGGHLRAQQTTLLKQLGLPTTLPNDKSPQLFEAMQKDKKVAAGQLNFVLPTELGKSKLVPSPKQQTVLDAIRTHID